MITAPSSGMSAAPVSRSRVPGSASVPSALTSASTYWSVPALCRCSAERTIAFSRYFVSIASRTSTTLPIVLVRVVPSTSVSVNVAWYWPTRSNSQTMVSFVVVIDCPTASPSENMCHA